MSVLVWIIGFCVLGGVLSVLAAGLFLLFPEQARQRALPHFVSFATGALLGAAFLALLPHALSTPDIDGHHIGLSVLLGLMLFFMLEKMVLWRHCHSHDCVAHGPSAIDEKHQNGASGQLILIGDAIHNFVDGVLIGAAFLTDVHLGIVTTLAVAAHELPQEVGDFAILLHSGYSRRKAFLLNAIASMTTVVGGVLAYFSLADSQALLPYVLSVAAASFIYVAVADLIPGLHEKVDFQSSSQQILLIIVGVVVVATAHHSLH